MTERMRVLYVLGTSGGGVGRHVLALTESLVEQGHSVTVAGPRSTEDALGFAAAGATFVAVPIAERPSLVGDPRSIRTLQRLSQEVDVVHAHGLRAGALAALAGRRAGPPLVVTLHNALVSTGLVAAAYAVLERIVARRADVVLGVSPDLEERQRRLGARRVGPAVVAAPTPRPLRRSVAETRAELGLGPTDRLVVSVARLAEQKGLPTLLDAVAIWSRQSREPGRAGVRVAIAGDGPARSPLQQRITAESLPVTLLGWRDDIPELLAAADVAVSSAVWEGQPIWLQEALGEGCPIVATDVGGTARVVGDAAVLVPPGDAAALAAAMTELLSDDGARERLRERAAARARDLPDAAAARDAVLAVYRDLLTDGSGDC